MLWNSDPTMVSSAMWFELQQPLAHISPLPRFLGRGRVGGVNRDKKNCLKPGLFSLCLSFLLITPKHCSCWLLICKITQRNPAQYNTACELKTSLLTLSLSLTMLISGKYSVDRPQIALEYFSLCYFAPFPWISKNMVQILILWCVSQEWNIMFNYAFHLQGSGCTILH